MKERFITVTVAVGVVISGYLFFSTLTSALLSGASEESISVPTEELPAAVGAALMPPAARQYATPTRLAIPSLNIDAGVQVVGINPAGRMANPTNFTDVGWYEYGPAPGEPGNAVIAGHVDNGLKLAGVFKELDTIPPGAEIFVTTADDETVRFAVTAIQRHPHDADTRNIFVNDGPPRLLLITCTGQWMPAEKMYAERLIIVAEPLAEAGGG